MYYITRAPGAAVGAQLDFDAELESVLKKQMIMTMMMMLIMLVIIVMMIPLQYFKFPIHRGSTLRNLTFMAQS